MTLTHKQQDFKRHTCHKTALFQSAKSTQQPNQLMAEQFLKWQP